MHSFKVDRGIDVIDLLKNLEETAGCYTNAAWSIQSTDAQSDDRSGADDFLDALLNGSETSSVPESPLWSPCTTESSLNEDRLTDPDDNLQSNHSTAFPSASPRPQVMKNAPGNEEMSDVCINVDWEPDGLQEELGVAYYLTTNQSSLLPSGQGVTVKDLLLSNLGRRGGRAEAQQIPQHALQELVLNEDEKRLLAKEGVKLPNRLPLSKVHEQNTHRFEERVLKKIRRKIRNKRSAQESRKKKREYVDSLEGRMSAINTHNLELQKKIHKLEETNNVLMEQLSQLQGLLPSSSSKPAQRGTCVLMLLLSFSLVISLNLPLDSSSQLSQAEYTQTKVLSRSLQSVDETQDAAPSPSPSTPRSTPSISRGFAEEPQPWTDLRAAGFPSSHHRDHNH